MGLMSAIKTAIFGKGHDKDKAGGTTAFNPQGGTGGTGGVGGIGTSGFGTGAPAAATPSPSATPWAQAPVTQSQAVSQVDVEQRLDGMSGADNLNWRTSIVDLMKLVGLESSLSERKELADELGYTGDKSDSAAMNIWLHKQVLKKLQDNGGKVPADLAD